MQYVPGPFFQSKSKFPTTKASILREGLTKLTGYSSFVSMQLDISKSDALAVNQFYFTEISTMVIPCFEQGTITFTYLLQVTETGFGLSNSWINFHSDDVKLEAE